MFVFDIGKQRRSSLRCRVFFSVAAFCVFVSSHTGTWWIRARGHVTQGCHQIDALWKIAERAADERVPCQSRI
jgi:hypothetical protein